MEQIEPHILKNRILMRRIIQAIIIAAIFIMAVTPMNHENDIFWQLRMGQDIVTKRLFPTIDPYSLPAQGEIWTLHEWLPSVLFYITYTKLGPTGLIILKAGIVSLTFTIFMVLFNRLKANLYLALLFFTLAALVNTRGVWVVFPSIFEYLFLVVTLYLLEVYREKSKRAIPIILSLLAFLWANSHGSFFLLPIIIGAYLGGDFALNWLKKRYSWYQPKEKPLDPNQRQSLIMVTVISLIAPFFTPNGYITYVYPIRISVGAFSRYVSEYQHFWAVWNGDWNDFVHGFFLILVIVLATLFILAIRKLHPADLLIAVFFAGLAFDAVRHVAIFALVALFLIIRYLGIWFGEYRGIFKRSLVKDLLIIVFVFLFTFFYKTKVAPFGFGLDEAGYPKTEAEIIMNGKVAGNMFNHYNFGGYLIGKMPEYQVFIDGRLEMYEGHVGQEYLTVLLAKPGYQKIIDKYNINFFILYLTDPIVELLLKNDAWRYIYHDKEYILLVKNVPQNSEFLAKSSSAETHKLFQEGYEVSLNQYRERRLTRQGITAAGQDKMLVALVSFQEAVRFEPQSISAHLNLGQVYEDLSLDAKAKDEYNYVLSQLDPKNEDAKNRLAQLDRTGGKGQ
jgi:hypothetical protein